MATVVRTAAKPKRILKTTNAYFYWVTREQGSFDWFKGVMNEVAELDQRVKNMIKTLLKPSYFLILFALFGGQISHLESFNVTLIRARSRCTTI